MSRKSFKFRVADYAHRIGRLSSPKPRQSPKPSGTPRVLASQFAEKIVTLYTSGQSTTQIARLIGMSAPSVCRSLKRTGVTIRPISDAMKLACTPERNQRRSQAMIGKPSGATGKTWKLKHRKQGMIGSANPQWKGGITAKHLLIRTSAEYKAWRTAVFERDNYRCQHCGDRTEAGHKVYLHADHIQPFATHPALRLELSNGRTLCKPCHKKTPTYGVNTGLAVQDLTYRDAESVS